MTAAEFREKYAAHDRTQQGRGVGLTGTYPGQGHPPSDLAADLTLENGEKSAMSEEKWTID